MVTSFFGVNGIGLVKILPEGTKLTSGYFKDEVLRQIYEESCGSSDLDCPTSLTLHYDNAPVQNASGFAERLAEYEFVQFVHPPYSPDLAPCDFFLFGYLREQWMQSAHSTPGEPEQAIVRTIEDTLRQTLLDVFASWGKQLEKCIKCDGK
jgi:histone-lysine N-methyltransferase SETMAR